MRRLLLLCSLALLGACATSPRDLAWRDRLDAQPRRFRLPRDSSDAAFERAQRWLRDRAAAREVIVYADRVETRPHPTGNQLWYSVARSYIDDDVELVVDVHRETRIPFDLVLLVAGQSDVDELALFVERGETYSSFAATYVPDSAAVAIALALDEERPNRAWLSLGTGAYDIGLEVGLRRDWYGFSYGAADFDGPYDPVPSYDSTLIAFPSASTRRESYRGLFSGVNLYGFVDLHRSVSLYGALGFYARMNTVLEHDMATDEYTQRGSSTSWTDFTPAVGAGIQASIADRIVIGAGFNTVTGALGHLGWRW